MTLTVEAVKRCREKTGRSMQDCKSQLLEAQRIDNLIELQLDAVKATSVDELRVIVTTLISYMMTH